jgi:hypothetical protein
MFARIPSASLSLWGRSCLVSALLGLPLWVSCTSSEDTEPFVPAAEGARQPAEQGALVSEDDACQRLLDAAQAAYERLNCDAPAFPDCPAFLRPGAGSGCYEYFDDSISACVDAYEGAATCRVLSPCLATAQLNESLATCDIVSEGTGGAGGAGPLANEGGAAGAAVAGAAAGGDSSTAGQPAAGAGG